MTSQYRDRGCPCAILGTVGRYKYKETQAGLEVPKKQQQSCGLRSPGLGPSIAPVRAVFVARNRKQMEYGEVAANSFPQRKEG